MLMRSIHRPPPNLYRFFSTSSCLQRHISHIGRTPIAIPPSAILDYTSSSSQINIKGPLGSTSVPIKPFVQLTWPQPDTLNVNVEDPEVKEQRQMWGTTRTLIYNAIVGMTEGFTVPLYLVGVGYRAALEDDPRGILTPTSTPTSPSTSTPAPTSTPPVMNDWSGKRLNMKLGFSHSIFVPIPSHIKASVPLPTKIILSCTDKHQLGLFAAKVRSFRPPEPYKGKGIFVGGETIRIKQVKKK